MTAAEVNQVIRALTSNGITVTALHTHMLDESPRLFFMHFWANDDGAVLAKALRAALDKMHNRKKHQLTPYRMRHRRARDRRESTTGFARRILFATSVLLLAIPFALGAQTSAASCAATRGSMTPVGWSAPGIARPPVVRARQAPAFIVDIPLPGSSKRFDYQSLDPTTGRLYISHMYGNRLDVFDTRAQKLLASNDGCPGATGVWAVPEQHKGVSLDYRPSRGRRRR